MRVIVYDRTSGDEETTGQAPKAQLALTVQMARERGHEVAASFGDEDVPGDSPWTVREGLVGAIEVAERAGAALFVREVSRLWRGDPYEGMILLRSIPNLVVADAPEFERRGGAWVRGRPSDEWPRFASLQIAWAEKFRLRERTGQVMGEIKTGRRETESGIWGRPAVEIEPAHVERARELRAGGASWTDVREEVLRLRGYYEVKDADARKRRDVSVDSIKRALGAKPRSPRAGHKSDPGTSMTAPAESGPARKGSLVPRGSSG